MPELDPELGQGARLPLGLDPLGHQATAGGPREVAHSHHERLSAKVRVDAADEAAVRACWHYPLPRAPAG